MNVCAATICRIVLCLQVLVIPSWGFGSPAPSREELKKKTAKQLKAILRSKGIKCKSCTEKEHFVDEVIDTWHVAPKEASSPDGKIQLTKEMFIQQLTSSLRDQRKAEGNPELQDANGHQLEGSGDALDQLPDMENIWADFAAKLASGEVSDKDGKLNYEVPPIGGYPPDTWWRRFKDYGMIILNFTLMLVLYKVRRRERRIKREEVEAREAGDKQVEDSKKSTGTKED